MQYCCHEALKVYFVQPLSSIQGHSMKWLVFVFDKCLSSCNLMLVLLGKEFYECHISLHAKQVQRCF